MKKNAALRQTADDLSGAEKFLNDTKALSESVADLWDMRGGFPASLIVPVPPGVHNLLNLREEPGIDFGELENLVDDVSFLLPLCYKT